MSPHRIYNGRNRRYFVMFLEPTFLQRQHTAKRTFAFQFVIPRAICLHCVMQIISNQIWYNIESSTICNYIHIDGSYLSNLCYPFVPGIIIMKICIDVWSRWKGILIDIILSSSHTCRCLLYGLQCINDMQD